MSSEQGAGGLIEVVL